MARPSHKPTDQTRLIVRNLRAASMTSENIAKHFEIDPTTLRKHYRHELDTGKTSVDAIVIDKLIQAIEDGNVTSIIFYLKTRLGWKESSSDITIENTPMPTITIRKAENKSEIH